jgi:DNA uptake protein ComE-like DNA-binding protein
MKKWWNAYFYWNSRERKGIFYLLIIVLLLAGVNLYLRTLNPEMPAPDAEFLALANRYNSPDEEEEDPSPAKTYGSTSFRNTHKSPKKFKKPDGPFNPNGLAISEWIKLGLSEAQAESIKRFEDKGGVFRSKEDLRKMYVISEEFYNHIEPYLVFPERVSSEPKAKESVYPQSRTVQKVDINTADSAQLEMLPGVSPNMVSYILKTRAKFGGFHTIEQLRDYRGFRPEYFEKLSAKAYVSEVKIKPVHLNYCTFSELLAVPGLDFETVKSIIKHRERNGHFQKTEDLVTLNLAEPGLYAKIAPYLTVP